MHETDVNSAMQGVPPPTKGKSQRLGARDEKKGGSGKVRKVRKAAGKGGEVVEKAPALPGDRKRGREESDDMDLDEIERQKGTVVVSEEIAALVSKEAGLMDSSCASQ